MPDSLKHNVIVVGGGWAGLSAATRLSQHGVTTTVFESAKQLGGRARCTPFKESRIDNGQHLMLGAYSDVLDVLRLCNVDLDTHLLRTKLDLEILDKSGDSLSIRTSNLPQPLDILLAIMFARGLTMRDKSRTLAFMAHLRFRKFRLEHDLTVKELLNSQPEKLVRMFWEPLCLAALNTPIDKASAQLFLNVLRDSFTGAPGSSELLFPRTDLGNLFVKPAMDYIDGHGGMVRIGQQAKKIQLSGDDIHIIDADGTSHHASQLVLATSPNSALRILEESGLFEETQQQLRQLHYEPICTIYLQYEKDVALERPMLGLSGYYTQWLFDRRFCGQPGLMAAVISATGPHSKLDKLTLSQLVSDELSGLFGWPDASDSLVIREKRATFQAHVNINSLRPTLDTPHPSIWLAGDYINGPYPATLEGAVRSGLQCADAIIRSLQGNL